MIGLARMAAHLADERTRKVRGEHYVGIQFERSNPVSRVYANNYPKAAPASLEYYRIIDRLTRGEKP